MENKRKLKRREFVFNLKAYDAETGDIAGWIVDASAEGLKMCGTAKFNLRQQIELTIELPEAILGKRVINCSANVQWIKPDVNPGLLATGLQLKTIAPEDHETLIGLMTRFSFNG